MCLSTDNCKKPLEGGEAALPSDACGMDALKDAAKNGGTVPEFVETVCVEQGKALNLKRHNDRMNATRSAFWGGSVPELSLEDWIQPESYEKCTRCRVVYAQNVLKVEYFPYQMRNVQSLKLVVCDEADYRYKSTDRSLLNRLFAERGEADDVLVVRNGLLTDTTIANIALFDGEVWYTPAHPLLKGTRRQTLLEDHLIEERDIKAEDIYHYHRIRLFNAMIPFGKIDFETKKAVC